MTCCHINSSERRLANSDVKNSQGKSSEESSKVKVRNKCLYLKSRRKYTLIFGHLLNLLLNYYDIFFWIEGYY